MQQTAERELSQKKAEAQTNTMREHILIAADSRKDIVDKINAQRATIREHITKYEKFKKEGSYTSSAEKTIKNSQAIIENLKTKTSGILPSYEDSWVPQ